MNSRFNQDDNCITTIESIHHLMDLDVGKHVLFLDEKYLQAQQQRGGNGTS
jgi:hypothetical protein